LRWGFFGADDFAPKAEPDARLGAAFDAPDFGRGAALPKLAMVLLASSFYDEHGRKKNLKFEALHSKRVFVVSV
jgi:hypothetical protein